MDDDKVAKVILERFVQSSAVISFAEIARFAKEIGRKRLAFLVCVSMVSMVHVFM